MGSPTILITGASGFIGSHFTDEALRLNMSVVAAIRPTSSKKYLTNEHIKFEYPDYTSASSLANWLEEIVSKYGSIDYIIHNAGITKAKSEKEYTAINNVHTRNLLQAISSSGISLQKFVLISSLAATGPGNPITLSPISTHQQANPITAYGKSKLKAEELLNHFNLPWIVIRPTAVYGPREKELFLMFNLISKGIQPGIRNKKQRLSFIYVKDLSRAVFELISSSCTNKTYHISDGNSYTNEAFGEHIKAALNCKTLKIQLSLKMLKIMGYGLELGSFFSSEAPGLNIDKAKEMSCNNWVCDITPITEDIRFKPEYNLDKGIAETVNWYKENGWLK